MQCATGRPWILAFMLPLNALHYPNAVAATRPMAMALPDGSAPPPTSSRTVQQYTVPHFKYCSGTWQRAQGVNLSSKFSRSQSDCSFMGRACIPEVPSSHGGASLDRVRHCKTVPGGPVSMPRRVRARVDARDTLDP